MESITQLLIDYGYWGMFLSAFLAGSFLPFSSEVVILGLLAAGLDPVWLIVSGSVGNVLGGMVNYGLGRLGKLDWLERHMHVKHQSVVRAQRYMEKYGAWIGFFAFTPIIGSAITIALGLGRANIWLSVFFITLGKVLRYAALVYGAGYLF